MPMSKSERLDFVIASLGDYDRLRPDSRDRTPEADWIAFKLGIPRAAAADLVTTARAAMVRT